MYKKRLALFGIISLLIIPLVKAIGDLDVATVINYILGTNEYTTTAMLRFGLCIVAFLLLFYTINLVLKGNTPLSVALALIISIFGIRFIPDEIILWGWNLFAILIFLLIPPGVSVFIKRILGIQSKFIRWIFIIGIYIGILWIFGMYMGYDFGDSPLEFLFSIVIFFVDLIFEWALGMHFLLPNWLKFFLFLLVIFLFSHIIHIFFERRVGAPGLAGLERTKARIKNRWERKRERREEARIRRAEARQTRREIRQNIARGILGKIFSRKGRNLHKKNLFRTEKKLKGEYEKHSKEVRGLFNDYKRIPGIKNAKSRNERRDGIKYRKHIEKMKKIEEEARRRGYRLD